MAETRHRRKGFRHLSPIALAGSLVFASPAAAQLLPGGGGLPALPTGPVLQSLPATVDRASRTLDGTLTHAVDRAAAVVRDNVGRPQGAAAIGRDLNGARVVRGEVVVLAPTPRSLAAARGLGLAVVRRTNLPALGLSSAVLRAPEGMRASDALAALRRADPEGTYDYNHIYDPSGEADAALPASEQTAGAATGVAGIGMIDAGIARHHPVFAKARIEAKTFAGDAAGPATAHGTAVASLLVGQDGEFRGNLPGTTLYAADVYGGEATGGDAASIVRALAWLAGQGVPVVNISLAGPPNALLGAAVRAFVRRGHVLVAAVGNDGPAAPLRYPAAYPGVIGVTSVDARRNIQLDANRGADVMFAARGVDVRVAAPKGGFDTVTGTSFAAPIVAARFAGLLQEANRTDIARARATLVRAAVDLGAPGRDPVFGYGYLTAPGSATAMPQAGLAQ